MTTIRRDEHGVLWADYSFEYSYKRSLGPVIGRCLTDLRDGQLTGVKTDTGKVLFPATEYDPDTSREVGDFVALQELGTVTTWAWVPNPRAKHPLDVPFAWALIQLDGSDTPFLHVVRVGSESEMSTGMRVHVVWSEERVGSILDIECFEPEASNE